MKNPQPVADETDHLRFRCPCGYGNMMVMRVHTDAFYCARDKADKCTYINLECPRCGLSSYRKIYWNRPKNVPPWNVERNGSAS